jgi:GWxTD domain-containing protein
MGRALAIQDWCSFGGSINGLIFRRLILMYHLQILGVRPFLLWRRAMKVLRTAFSLLIASCLVCPQQSFAAACQQDDYKRGLALKEEGRYEDALKFLWQARTALEMNGTSDPRIGIAFIELATEQKMEKYYGTASEMYFWGFSRVNVREFKEDIEAEVERILPLLEDDVQKEWQTLLEQGSNTILQKIRQFWIEKDPRPTTPGNERLIEHWQRIAYARNHFTKNRYGVYGSDDRGTIYVKYGEPERTKAGFMHARAGRGEDYRPEFEVWLYSTLKEDETTTFFFANRDGGGAFRLMGGIEDAFGKNGRGKFQIMNYAIVKNFDETFRERFLELESIWIDDNSGKIRSERALGTLIQNIYQRNKTRDHFAPNHKYADVDKSDYESSVAQIDVYTYNIRLLDSRNRPKLAVIAISSPKFRAQEVRKTIASASPIPAYRLEHTLIVRDTSLREIDRKTGLVGEEADNVSVFLLDQTPERAHYTVAAEALEVQPVDSPAQNRAAEDSSAVLALGKAIFRPEPPLSAERDSLELSGLVLGVESPAGVDFPFPLVPARQFSPNDPLQVYVEVYHLQQDTDGTARFRMDFRVAKLDKKGWVQRKAGQISLSFDLQASGRTSKEIFGVDISELKPGTYELLTTVRDIVSGQEKSRKTKFEVMKSLN